MLREKKKTILKILVIRNLLKICNMFFSENILISQLIYIPSNTKSVVLINPLNSPKNAKVLPMQSLLIL